MTLFKKPDLERNMRGIDNLNVVNPKLWAKTFEASGLTADDVRAAVKAEKTRRDEEKILRERPEVLADD